MRIRVFIVSVLTLWLGGCASSTGPNIDSLAQLQTAKKGVAILKVSYPARCPYGTMMIGKKAGDKYERVATQITRKGYFSTNETIEVQLDPGQYHIISYSCVSGRYAISVPKIESGFFTQTYKQSLANFELRAGEIVNAGHLVIKSIMMLSLANAVEFQVVDLNNRVKQDLQKRRPKLYGAMTTRLMKTKKANPAGLKIRCMLERLSAMKISKDKPEIFISETCKKQGKKK